MEHVDTDVRSVHLSTSDQPHTWLVSLMHEGLKWIFSDGFLDKFCYCLINYIFSVITSYCGAKVLRRNRSRPLIQLDLHSVKSVVEVITILVIYSENYYNYYYLHCICVSVSVSLGEHFSWKNQQCSLASSWRFDMVKPKLMKVFLFASVTGSV